jgi:two-component system, chemotaxis family, protein-glutamate methylesterase/glutaminase
VVGVVLTGMLDDGTSGLMVVAANGGAAIVEDPQTAVFPSMPASALEHVPTAHATPLSELPEMLLRMISEQLDSGISLVKEASSDVGKEIRIAELDMAEIAKDEHPGRPSPFACPDCGGVLWEIEQNDFLRFRCRVGHAFTARYLGTEQRHAVETALWEALRALEESASLYRRMAARANAAKHDLAVASYLDRASGTESNSRILREFLLQVNKHESIEDPAIVEPPVVNSPKKTHRRRIPS